MKQKIYEGKAKILYRTEKAGELIQEFKDDVTAFDAVKKATVQGKGVVNCAISSLLFLLLESRGIPTHFLKRTSDREMLIRELKMIPVEVVVRNLIAGSMAKRLGKKEGERLNQPVVEFYLKNDALHDPWLNEDHIKVFGLASAEEVASIRKIALEVNSLLQNFFQERGILLVDMKLEFGRDKDGILRVGDEITPDSIRLWDATTGKKLDKDVFRRDLGDLLEAYGEVLKRLEG
ncbi:MAG: phosphoribosylaminoimidazolesuccinocarboxamide synthase [bacterium]